jgi:hypothetical protein
MVMICIELGTLMCIDVYWKSDSNVYRESESNSDSDGVYGIRNICVRCKSDSNVHYTIFGHACCTSEAMDLFE